MACLFGFLLTVEADMRDTLLRSRPVTCAAILIIGISTAMNTEARGPKDHELGDLIPKGAEILDANCAHSPMTLSRTLSWVKKRFRGPGSPVEFSTIVDRPGVYARHAALGTKARPWNRVNVSQIGQTIHLCFLRDPSF